MKKVILFLALAMMFANTEVCSAKTDDPFDTFRALHEQVKARNDKWTKDIQEKEEAKEVEEDEDDEDSEEPEESDSTVEKVADESVVAVKPAARGDADELVFKADHNNKFSFEVGSWKTELDGHLQIADDNNEFVDINKRIDFGRDINISKETIPSFKLSYKFGGKTTMEISYLKQEQDGNLSIAGKVFNGKNFQAGAHLEVENEWYDIAWKRKLARTLNSEGNETSSAGLIFGVKTNKAYAKVQDPQVGGVPGEIAPIPESKDWDKTFPVPYLGLNGSVSFGNRLFVDGDFRYFKLNYDDYEAKYHDYIVELAYRVTGDTCKNEAFLKAGYRSAEYDVSGKGDAVLLEYKGPVFYLEFKF